jgi:rod shape-determining protein MreC
LRPFEVAADRVARPFADTISWFRGLVDAKNENEKLRAQNESLRRQLILDEGAIHENVELRKALNYIGPPSIADYDRIDTSVVVNPQSALEDSIVIGAGSSDGVRAGSVVVEPLGGPDGSGALVGIVDRVFAGESRVTLLTDSESAVTATDVTNPRVIGAVRRGGGSTDVLILDRVPKTPVVRINDTIVTAGSLGAGPLKSKFPRGIPIGTVSSRSANDTTLFQNIQLKPFVDFSSIQTVVVLVPKSR